jgi:hypothetical protein
MKDFKLKMRNLHASQTLSIEAQARCGAVVRMTTFGFFFLQFFLPKILILPKLEA